MGHVLAPKYGRDESRRDRGVATGRAPRRYVIVERRSTGPLRCAVVDPGDADAVLEALRDLREQHYDLQDDGTPRPEPVLVVTALLVTHKHWDHQAGVRKVLRVERPRTKAHASLTEEDAAAAAAADAADDAADARLAATPGEIAVVAGENEPVKHVTHRAADGARFRVGATLDVEVVPAPCHTKGHVMFGLVGADGARIEALFTGDALFCGGCGAPFEGDAKDVARNFRALRVRRADTSLMMHRGDAAASTWKVR